MNTAYAYLYDDFLADRQFADFLAEFETKLAAMGMSGQVARLSMFRNAQEVVEGFMHKGAKTIVAVGNEKTLDKLMWFLPNLDVVLGYVPVAAGDKTAALLGLPWGVRATEALGARLIEALDVGKIGERYFLTEAILEKTSAKLTIEEGFSLKLINGGKIIIRNLGTLASAQDGLLEAELLPAKLASGFKDKLIERMGLSRAEITRLMFKKGELVCDQPMQIEADGFTQSGFKLPIGIEPKKLKIIIGKFGR